MKWNKVMNDEWVRVSERGRGELAGPRRGQRLPEGDRTGLRQAAGYSPGVADVNTGVLISP